MSKSRHISHRTILRQVESLSLVSGAVCVGQSGPEELQESVPAAYRTTTSQGGTKCTPETLTSKAGANYSSTVREREQTCTTCRDYVLNRNGDRFSACSVVEGYIEQSVWRTLYALYRETPA